MRLKVTGVMIALALAVMATVTYGPSIVDLYRRAATYVAKVLKGVKLPSCHPLSYQFCSAMKASSRAHFRAHPLTRVL